MATTITTDTNDNKKENDQCTPLIVPLTQSLGVATGYNASFDVSGHSKSTKKRSSIMRLLKPSIAENAGMTEKISYIFVKYFFLIGLIICLLIGILYPKLASSAGPLHPKITSSWICVIIIFSITGIAVRTRELKKAGSSWQLNVFVHFIMFVMFPTFGVAIGEIIKQIDSSFNQNLLKGLIITCCIPTTIGTAVVFTQNARGNDVASVVNTTLANLLGIVICPGLIFLLVGGIGSDISLGGIALSLCLRVLVPFVTGQIIRSFLGTNIRHWMKPKKPYFKKVTEICLLFIIWCAISQTFYNGFEAEFIEVIIMLMIVVLLHGFSLLLVWFLSGLRSKSVDEFVTKTKATSIIDENYDESDDKQNCWSNCFVFDIYDRIAITFTSTQKAVGVGVPMIETLYVGQPSLVGMFIVPLLLYGIVQLIVDSFIVSPMGNKAKKYAKQMYEGLLQRGVTGKRLLSARCTMDRVEALCCYSIIYLFNNCSNYQIKI